MIRQKYGRSMTADQGMCHLRWFVSLQSVEQQIYSSVRCFISMIKDIVWLQLNIQLIGLSMNSSMDLSNYWIIYIWTVSTCLALLLVVFWLKNFLNPQFNPNEFNHYSFAIVLLTHQFSITRNLLWCLFIIMKY